MISSPTRTPRPLPLWMTAAGSLFALGHLLAIGLYCLAAPSGPWLVPPPPTVPASMEEGPQFAKSISMGFTYPCYLEPLRMTHNYHFQSNRPAEYAVYFEVQLKNELGDVTTLKFPDEKANFWVQHRQQIL